MHSHAHAHDLEQPLKPDGAVGAQRADPRDQLAHRLLVALARLADLGVEVEGIDLAGIRYRDGQRSVDARFRAGPGRGVRRTTCLLYTSPSPRDPKTSRMPSSA